MRAIKIFPLTILVLLSSSAYALSPDEEVTEAYRDKPILAADGRTSGQLIYYDNACNCTYAIALTLLIQRDGKPLAEFDGNGQMIWEWEFKNDGNEVMITSGPTHGEQCTRRLYNVTSKNKVSEEPCANEPSPAADN